METCSESSTVLRRELHRLMKYSYTGANKQTKQKKIQEPVWHWRTKIIEWLVFYGWILHYEKKNKTATFLGVKVHKYTKYTIWPWIKIVDPKLNSLHSNLNTLYLNWLIEDFVLDVQTLFQNEQLFFDCRILLNKMLSNKWKKKKKS